MELRHSRHFMCMNTQNLQSICINNYLYGYPPTYGNGNGFCATTSKSIYHVPFDFSIFVILNVVPRCSSISLSDPKVCCLINAPSVPVAPINAFISVSVAVLKLAKPNFFNATSLSSLCNHISKLYDDLLIMPSMSGIRCRPNCALVWLP